MAMNWKILLGGAVLVVPLVAVLASGFGSDPRGSSNALEGQRASDFALESLDGDRIALADLAGGPVVINFWATWCQPCLAEHPILLEGARRYKARGVTFLGVLYDDDAELARRYVGKHGAAFPTLLDPGNHVAIDYGVVGVPETFFLDQRGRVFKKHTGPLDFQTMVETLEILLSAETG